MNLLMCCKCKKPVDKIIQYEDFKTGQIVFEAYCHGKTEETRLNKMLLLIMNKNSLKFEKAFKGNVNDNNT